MSGTVNPERLRTIKLLKKLARKHEAKIWWRLAEFLEKPKRRRVAVNVSRMNR